MGNARHGQTGNRDGRDGRMPSGLSGDVVNENVTGYLYFAVYTPRPTPISIPTDEAPPNEGGGGHGEGGGARKF